jgi:hypothetical protein
MYNGLMQNSRCSCRILTTLDFASTNINFLKINLVEAELFHADRRTDKQDEANSRFSQFYDSA